MVNDQRFAPDVAYVGPDKPTAVQPRPARAVEVVSDESNRKELKGLETKLRHYRAAGVTVWVVLPRAQRVEVHAPDDDPAQDPLTLGPDDTLAGPALLPDFRLPLRELFDEQEAN